MRVSSAQIIRNFGKLSDLALNEPIIITKNGRDRLVLLGIDEYNQLREWMESGTEARGAVPKPQATPAPKPRKKKSGLIG